jgi:large subunit ribosomal protein L21
MYAVIESGGKQYRVELGSEIQVDRLDVRPGESITLERVLLVADGDEASVGQPLVDGASVSAEVLRQERGEKIVVFKYKPKARTRVKKGHRAELTTLRIADIAVGGKSAAKAAQQAESRKGKAQKEAEQAAEEKAAADRELAAKLAAAETPAPKRTAKRTRQPEAATAETAPTAAPAEDADGPADLAPPATTRSTRPRRAAASDEAPEAQAEDAGPAAPVATSAEDSTPGTENEPESATTAPAADDDTRKDG